MLDRNRILLTAALLIAVAAGALATFGRRSNQHALHQDPEHAVAVVDPGPCDAPLENGKLMTKGDVFEREPLAVLEPETQEESDLV